MTVYESCDSQEYFIDTLKKIFENTLPPYSQNDFHEVSDHKNKKIVLTVLRCNVITLL